ncbi:MAG: hypothetical protein RIB98_12075 [Acidimicrobiales bacterium]
MEQDSTLAVGDRSATSRRTLLKSGAAASAAIWAAPSILSLDAVAAAAGSCLVPTRQVDFSRFANSRLPSSFLSDHGSVSITFAISDPWGRQDPSYRGFVFNGGLNGRDNPVVTGMNNARNGNYVDLVFTFSVPVCPTFWLIDVDRASSSWEDTVRVIGSNGAGTINPSAMNVGGAQTVVSANTVRGNTSTSGSNGNVEVVFDQAITRLEIRHQDNSNWTAFQWIAVHDFLWC